jgi:integrase
MRLSDRQIAALPSPERGQKLYSDDTVPGFAVRVSQGGAKTFVLTYGADRRRFTIGRYGIVTLAQARDKAKTILAARQLGVDPLSPRFEDVLDEYLAHRERTVRKSTYDRDRYQLAAFNPLHRKRIGELTAAEVQDTLDRITAPHRRHDTLIRFSCLIKYAQKQGQIQTWPLHRLHAPVQDIPRDRVLDPAELKLLLSTARIWREAGNQFWSIVEILTYSGQRRQQIGSLHRRHVDFDEQTLTWEPALMKTGKRHSIPLGDHVRSLLDPRVNGLFFPNLNGDPFSGWSVHVRKFKRDVGFADWFLHDLRRVLATGWQEMGVEIAVTERMLSHSAITGGLVGIYQKSTYMAQMRVAVQRWEDYLQAL